MNMNLTFKYTHTIIYINTGVMNIVNVLIFYSNLKTRTLRPNKFLSSSNYTVFSFTL